MVASWPPQLFGFGDNSFGHKLGCVNDSDDNVAAPKCKLICPTSGVAGRDVLSPSELMAFSPSVYRDPTILLRVSQILAGTTHSLIPTVCPRCAEAARAAQVMWREGPFPHLSRTPHANGDACISVHDERLA